MRSLKIAAAAALAVLALTSASFAGVVLFDFESGSQGWGSFGVPTTDSGVLPEGSVGQGRYHAFQADLGGWGIIDVSPLGLDLTPYTGFSVDARLVDIAGYPPYAGPKNVDIGIGLPDESEFYAAPVTLTSSYQTYAVNLADFVPAGTNLANVQIKLRILMGAGTAGVGRFDYDQITAVPEPAALVLLGLLALLRRR